MNILLVEDSEQTINFIAKGLHDSGHSLEVIQDGVKALELATSKQYDVMIVDRMIPKIDGLNVIRTLRSENCPTPILVLSALAEIDDKVAGLRAGSDDYLAKPFAFAELLARVEVLGRRKKLLEVQDSKLYCGNLCLDLLRRAVLIKGEEEIPLREREFLLLSYLMKHKNQTVTRAMLLEAVWDYHFDPQTNIIDVHISRLRKKINDSEGDFIKTVRGIGYTIEA